jgi:hypothetical protein
MARFSNHCPKFSWDDVGFQGTGAAAVAPPFSGRDGSSHSLTVLKQAEATCAIDLN